MVFQDFESQLFSTNVAHEVAFAMEQVGMDRVEMDRRSSRHSKRLAYAASSIAIQCRCRVARNSASRSRRCSRCALSVIVLDEPTTDLDSRGQGGSLRADQKVT